MSERTVASRRQRQEAEMAEGYEAFRTYVEALGAEQRGRLAAAEVAQAFGVGTATAVAWIARYGVEQDPYEAFRAYVDGLRESGTDDFTVSSVAAELGLDTSTASALAARYADERAAGTPEPEPAGEPKPLGFIERIYYAVPTSYGIGEEFEDAAAAVEAARATIQVFEYPGQKPDHRFSRAFVDVRWAIRWADGTRGDEVVKRTEVFLDKASQTVLRPGDQPPPKDEGLPRPE